MPFLGNIINFASVLGLGILGALIKRALPERITSAITCALGVCVLYIGVDGALEKTQVTEGFPLSAGLFKVLVMILSMVIGTFIGEILDLDKLMTRLGAALEKKLCRPSDAQSGNFAKGFVSCTLLFCIGAMAVNGSIADAMGSPDILIAKAVIDGISVFMMATTLGIGCAFSAFPMLIYQGAIAVITYFAQQLIPTATITYLSVTGSLIIIFIATNMIGITKIKTANMVPAIFVPLAICPIMNLF